MPRLYEPPPTFELPLSKGGDVYFGIVYKPLVVDEAGEPVLDDEGKRQYAEADYPDGATVQVVIETNPPEAPDLVIDADIAGSVATVWGDVIDTDTVKPGKLWRATITYADGLDKVLCNGKTSRFDG